MTQSGVGWARELAGMPRADLARRLLLFALLLRPVGGPWLRPCVVALAALGLLSPRALRSAALWLALAALTALRVALAWPLSDNHAYLLVYACLAAGLAALADDDDGRLLAWNARWLLAGTFAFATLWKLALAPDYLDGTFFRVTLVGDPRFEAFARLAGGLDAETFDALRALVREHSDGVFVPWPELPPPPPRFGALAAFLTVVTVALEGALALAFAAPWRGLLARARDPLLLLFCATTYALAPVAGFGFLLVALGVAQTAPERVCTRIAYAAVFAWILVATRWPWLDALAGL
jgi:hypothetical protein